MAKDCPFCSTDKDRPAVEMPPLRKLLLMVWRMELAGKNLLDDGYDPIRDPLAEGPDYDIPLTGLQIKLADINIQVQRILGKALDSKPSNVLE